LNDANVIGHRQQRAVQLNLKKFLKEFAQGNFCLLRFGA